MRTLILSDVHLGNGRGYDIYAGGAELPALLDRWAARGNTVIFNGDTFDYLMNEDPLRLKVSRAEDQTRQICRNPETSAVLRSVGKILAAGGEVVVRVGNHDIELALPEVQKILQQSLGQPRNIGSRLRFELGEEPRIATVNGARILVAHGEHSDQWNRIDWKGLKKKPKLGRYTSFDYPAGSRLVKKLLNPLKRDFQMRFADLLKPDFQGAAMAAVAVNPTAVKLVAQGTSLRILWQLFRTADDAFTFADDEDDDGDLGLADAVDQAGLTDDEIFALEELLDPEAMFDFAEGDEDPHLKTAALKMARQGFQVYAKAQARLAGDSGDRYFELQPTDGEWTEAGRLASKYRAQAIVLGHTHSARFRQEGKLTYVNSGTWINLMQLPPADAGEEDWLNFLRTLRRNPALDPGRGEAVPTIKRFTGVTVEPHPGGGASVSLIEWQNGQSTVLSEAQVTA